MARSLTEDMFSNADFVQQYAGGGAQPLQGSTVPAAGLPNFLASTLGGALPTGLQSILDILNRGGRTDPAMLNRQRVANFRNTEGALQGLAGRSARNNLTGSGVHAAIQAAQEGAGLDRDAAILARDSDRAAGREFDAAKLLLSMIAAESRNQAFLGDSAANRKVAKDAAFDQFLANLLGGGTVGGALDLLDRFTGGDTDAEDKKNNYSDTWNAYLYGS